jgi:2-oxoglutarate dehydrogenase E1 component
MDNYTYLSNATPEYLENLYRDFKTNPTSVDTDFRKFFEGFDFATINYNGKSSSFSTDELKVYNLIQAYRNKGHLIAHLNPLGVLRDRKPNLSLDYFGLSDKNLDHKYAIGSEIDLPNATLKEIIAKLEQVYCKSIGWEYGYVRQQDQIDFLRSKIEKTSYSFSIPKKEHILRKLNHAVIFEKFLGTKYIGEKRFSLEGGETTVPALDSIIEKSAELGVEEVVIGMAHRGRLNILANIMGKTYEQIFNEFEGKTAPDTTMGDGDVKYHLGFSHQHPTQNGKTLYLKLCPNPSHLEAVGPVVAGFARSKADVIYKSDYDKILPILIHGDAAVAGQGIVYEQLQMMNLEGYSNGGSIHFVINNQIGFTTSLDDARSSDYCTSIAATVEAPVIHVNGDDIEAVVYAAEVAAEYRQKFNKDIFIDMICYRKWGHNESDDPKYTQPVMYSLIDGHKNPRDIYKEKLEAEGSMSAELAQKMEKEFWDDLQARLDLVKQSPLPYKPQSNEKAWEKLGRATEKDFEKSPDTSIKKALLDEVVKGLFTVPENFKMLKKVEKQMKEAQRKIEEDKVIDWASAELIAYGTILMDGKNVRLSGEDVKRGTFTHRHAVWTDEKTDQQFNRLSDVAPGKQGRFLIYNSHLSEYGVLGFEYGYTIASPDALVLWEAQFGDFGNGAQIIIDQFIAAGESKWQRPCGMVMLLPHGYEGQGPEHSSARLERFLQQCAELNMVVVNITDPANFFHVLRRQLTWNFRKPLIVMSPKSLLRHPRCVSDAKALTSGGFREVIDDENVGKSVRRVLLVSGRLYFDLLERKETEKATDIAIVRLEQIYPLPEKQLLELKKKYSKAEFVWVQDEPKNMGAWTFLLTHLYEKLPLRCISRKPSASPATGYKKVHLAEQEYILKTSFEK